MPASQTPESIRPQVLAIGPLPPPVTGLAVLTEKVVERLQETGPVTILNMSPGPITNLPIFRVKRFLRTLGCLGRLVVRGRARNTRLYIVANSKGGLLTTFAMVNAGRLLGYPVYLHHHAYFYIDRYDWRMAWIDRSLGPGGVYVVHCPQMADDFRAMYGTKHPFECVLPSVFSLPLAAPRQSTPVPFRLGHMGNLSIAKGLDLVLQTFRELLKSGCQIQLRLAGPFLTKGVKRIVQQALEDHPALIEYSGPVYGQAKTEFFRSIDCFLFPSRSESWGIVLNEAMAAGVPVIACQRGCTQTLVGDRAGLVVKDSAQYVQLAVRQIRAWMDDADQYRAASAAAIEQTDVLDREAQTQLNAFAEHMHSPLAGPSLDGCCQSRQPC